MLPPRLALMMLFPLLLQARAAFDPAKDVLISVSAGVLTVTAPPGVHLKARAFRILLISKGTLHTGALPATDGQDEAGDPIWRGTVKVALTGTGLEDPTLLVITYQPCTEGPDGMCFLPVKRTLAEPAMKIPTESP